MIRGGAVIRENIFGKSVLLDYAAQVGFRFGGVPGGRVDEPVIAAFVSEIAQFIGKSVFQRPGGLKGRRFHR